MDGRLQLSRVVRKDVKYFEHRNPQGHTVVVPVECLAPEDTPRQLVAILCNDLLVLCKDPTKGRDANAIVELWAVLRMQTLPQPASIHQGRCELDRLLIHRFMTVHSDSLYLVIALRLVDHKAILYFDMGSTSEALTWSRGMTLKYLLMTQTSKLTAFFFSHQHAHTCKSIVKWLFFLALHFLGYLRCSFLLSFH